MSKTFIWEFDQEAINEVTKMLGFKYAVKVRGKRGRRGTSPGHYDGIEVWDSATHRNCEPTHFIAIDRRASQEIANETLWHELCHAYQMEQDIESVGGDIFAGQMEHNRKYDAEIRRLGKKSRESYVKVPHKVYRQNRFEDEAYNYEQCAEYMPLVKITKYGKERLAQIVKRREDRRKFNDALTEAAMGMAKERQVKVRWSGDFYRLGDKA